MNRNDLAEVLAIKAGLNKSKSREVIDLMFQSMEECFSMGNDVMITGFGAFKLANRSSRLARNPKTGEKVSVAPSKNVKFILSKQLKEKLNQ